MICACSYRQHLISGDSNVTQPPKENGENEAIEKAPLSCTPPKIPFCSKSSVIYKGQASAINSIAFSPDNQFILSGDADSTIKLWTLEGKLNKIFKGHTKQVNAVAFSHTGQYILSGSHDKTLRLWDRESQCVKRIFIDETGEQSECTAHLSGIKSVTFSPDGAFILSSASTLKLWRVEDGTLLQTFPHKNTINSIHFSLDGTKIVLGTSDGTLSLLKKKEGQDTYTEIYTKKYPPSINSVVFLSDSQKIIIGQPKGKLQILTFNKQNKVIKTYFPKKYTQTINTVLYSEKGIFTGSNNGLIKWQKMTSPNNTVWKTLSLPSDDLSTFAISSNQKYFCAVSDNKSTLTIWDINGKSIRTFKNGSQEILASKPKIEILPPVVLASKEPVILNTGIEPPPVELPPVVEPPPVELPVITVTSSSIKEMSIDKPITHIIKGMVTVSKYTTFEEYLYNLAEYLSKDHHLMLHPSHAPKPRKLQKRSYQELLKEVEIYNFYSKKNKTKIIKIPSFPKSGKLTKRLKELYEQFKIYPKYYAK